MAEAREKREQCEYHIQYVGYTMEPHSHTHREQSVQSAQQYVVMDGAAPANQQQFQDTPKRQHLVYNVHIMTHIHELSVYDCRMDILWNYYLQRLRVMVRSTVIHVQSFHSVHA